MCADESGNAGIEAKVEAKLLKLSGRIAEIKAEIKDKEGDARLHGEQIIRTLEGQRDALRARFDEMKEASGDALAALKESVKLGLHAIEEGVEKSYKWFHKDQM
jgi:hypothetical protein